MEQIYRTGIDYGYGNIKTAHHIFESGVIERESASELAALAKELQGRGLCNDTRYHVKIEDVEVYAQGFAAVAAYCFLEILFNYRPKDIT